MERLFMKLPLSLVILILFITGCSSMPIRINTAATLNDDGWITKDSFYEKVVHYGTTRVDSCKNTDHYNSNCKNVLLRLNTGNDRSENEIAFGRAKVRIPYSKKVGGTAGMSLVALEHNITWNDFISKLTDDDLLIFVHGFNTSFTNAAIRCAQLSHDTNFKGEAVFFSWPSAENPTTYAIDKKRAKENFGLLADFLQDISSQTDKNIHIVAHSMGTYILINSLAVIKSRIDIDKTILDSRREKNNGKIFNQIILAAPDIAKDDYYKKFSGYDFKELADRFTLYSSVNDHVLDASQIINYFVEGTNQARLGDSQNGFFVIDGMDTVDTRQEISPQFFGHSFYANYRSLVSDMYVLLSYGTEPDYRMLQKVIDTNNSALWFIRD